MHRDLKPANVIVAKDGPRIIDFGIARTPDASALTTHGTAMGTYTYMSPEQVRGESAEPESDVFSLGCVPVFALTGRSPFEAPTLPAIVHRLLTRDPDFADVGGRLHPLIEGCLAKEPADRPLVTDVVSGILGASSEREDTGGDRLGRNAVPVLGLPFPVHGSEQRHEVDVGGKLLLAQCIVW